MGTYSAKQIQDNALVPGGEFNWVEFLKSEKVAKGVADRVWDHLLRNGYKHRQRKNTVFVKPSPYRRGTWKVEVFMGLSYADSVPGGREMNEAESSAALAALRASYTSADLVTTWTY